MNTALTLGALGAAMGAAWLWLRSRAPAAPLPPSVPAVPPAAARNPRLTVPQVSPAPLPRLGQPVPRYPHADVVELVRREVAAAGGGLGVVDVLATIEVESGFLPRAFRAEPRLGDASYGLMQILLSTARDRGFSGPAAGLYDPETNVRVGIAQLLWIKSYLTRRRGRVPDVAEWIGAYNAGVGNVLKGYVPLAYVNKWTAARERWRARLAGGVA